MSRPSKFTSEQEKRFQDAIQFRNSTKELIKSVQKVSQSTSNHTEDEIALSQQLIKFVSEEWMKQGTDLDVPKYMRYFATTLNAVASVRAGLSQDMQSQVIAPLTNMADYDFLEATELKAKVEATTVEYDATCKKIETLLTGKALKKKKGSSDAESQIHKFEGDLERLRQDLDRQTNDFDQNLGDIHHKKETKLLRCMLLQMQLQYNFYEKAYRLMQNLKPKMELVEKELAKAEAEAGRGVYKEGHLYKKTNQMGQGGWVKCWYVLKDGLLYCYKGKKDTQEEKALNVAICKASIPMGKNLRKDEYIIELYTPEKKKAIVLRSDTDEERQSWINALQCARETQIVDSVLSGDSSSLSTKKKGEKVSEEDNKVFKIIRAVPGNLYCADCGMEDPDWASINLGILVCLQCSGVHRSLGTHISKVRSMTLDKKAWEPELLMFMKACGNEKFNAVYEANMPPDVKPSPSDDRMILERVIKAKYVGRQYIEEPPSRDEDWLNSELYSRVATTDDEPMSLLHLIGCGAKVNWHHPQDEDKSSLHTAVIFDKVMYLEVLIQNGGDVFDVESRRWTPMHFAAYYNRVHCAALLAKHGFNKRHFEFKDWQNKTASEVAHDNESFDIIRVLSGEKVEVGPTIDELDDTPAEPLVPDDPLPDEEDEDEEERLLYGERAQSMMVPKGTMGGVSVLPQGPGGRGGSLIRKNDPNSSRRASAPPNDSQQNAPATNAPATNIVNASAAPPPAAARGGGRGGMRGGRGSAPSAPPSAQSPGSTPSSPSVSHNAPPGAAGPSNPTAGKPPIPPKPSQIRS